MEKLTKPKLILKKDQKKLITLSETAEEENTSYQHQEWGGDLLTNFTDISIMNKFMPRKVDSLGEMNKFPEKNKIYLSRVTEDETEIRSCFISN